MSTEPFVGEIKLFGFAFTPLSYAQCDGALMSIAQNTALFALLGTTYGGDGQTTFARPDLRGRMPIGEGTGPGLPSYDMGEEAGSSSVTLITANLAPHVHTLGNMHVQLKANTANAGETSPDGTFPASTGSPAFADSAENNIFTGGAILSGTTDISGSNIPLGITMPYLTLNYCLAVEGIFPSRN